MKNIIERLRAIETPYRKSKLGKPIVSYDEWIIYLAEDGTLKVKDFETNTIDEVECFSYYDYDDDTQDEDTTLESKSDYCGEFDDCTGFGYFRFINYNMTIITLRENTDTDVIYGALKVPADKIKEIQKEIYKIKERFYDKTDEWYNDAWDIEDLIIKLQEKFPEIETVAFENTDYLEC